MSVSTLPNYFVKEKRLLFVGDSTTINGISQAELPDNYLLVSYFSLRELIRNFNSRTQLPDAIIINLNTVSLNRLSPIMKKIKGHESLNKVPIIGLKGNYSTSQRNQLIKIGFNDCFCSPINWEVIEQRIKFLNKYKNKLTLKRNTEEIDEPYKMPTSKRIFDIAVAASLLLLLSPFLLLVAILIKLESKGPVFYTSKRVGTGYQVFDFIKFRSMIRGADASLSHLIDFNNYDEKSNEINGTATFFKMEDDPRVTFIGKIIRKTSIDELPQLINVLRGEMSIVGNRPLPIYEATQLTCDDWAKRFMAPAGLTGLWQVDERGKDNLSSEERIRLDMNYADNYSLWLDFKILLKTLPAMKQKE